MATVTLRAKMDALILAMAERVRAGEDGRDVLKAVGLVFDPTLAQRQQTETQLEAARAGWATALDYLDDAAELLLDGDDCAATKALVREQRARLAAL